MRDCNLDPRKKGLGGKYTTTCYDIIGPSGVIVLIAGIFCLSSLFYIGLTNGI